MRNPWRDYLGTLTGRGVWLTRLASSDGGLELRLLSGVECMRAIGWGLQHWRDPKSVKQGGYSDTLLRSLAGNAYSAFACGPPLAASLAALGLPASELLPSAELL
eukprot:3697445-Pyramimonas_sp.AAC.1